MVCAKTWITFTKFVVWRLQPSFRCLERYKKGNEDWLEIVVLSWATWEDEKTAFVSFLCLAPALCLCDKNGGIINMTIVLRTITVVFCWKSLLVSFVLINSVWQYNGTIALFPRNYNKSTHNYLTIRFFLLYSTTTAKLANCSLCPLCQWSSDQSADFHLNISFPIAIVKCIFESLPFPRMVCGYYYYCCCCYVVQEQQIMLTIFDFLFDFFLFHGAIVFHAVCCKCTLPPPFVGQQQWRRQRRSRSKHAPTSCYLARGQHNRFAWRTDAPF